jgi:hypothetical protein
MDYVPWPERALAFVFPDLDDPEVTREPPTDDFRDNDESYEDMPPLADSDEAPHDRLVNWGNGE